MAALMSPTEHANLWNSEAKIHRLGNFTCKCVDMGAMAPSCDTLWRLRPEFSLSVRVPGKQYRRIVGLNSWMRFQATKSSVHMLGSRMEDACLFLRPFKLSSARDSKTILKCLNSDSLVSKQSSGDLIVRSGLYTSDMDTAIYKGSDFNGTFFERDQPTEEPWSLQSSLLYHYAPHSNSSTCLEDEDKLQQHDISNSLETKSFEQSILNVHPNSRNVNALSSNYKGYVPDESNQPVEEPWLFGFSLFLSSDTKVVSNNECVKEEPSHPKVYDPLHQVTEQLVPEDESSAVYPYDEWNIFADQKKSSAVSQMDSVSRVILINSSVCTMQRIAVLEDGKLVEVFLEPVKNNILCDSIYLGVVTESAPQGGAFVNIGGRKPSFMEINHAIEPFIFPPFCRHTKLGEVNGSAFVMPEKIQNNSSVVEVEDEIDGVDIDDDALHDECAEHEISDYAIREVHMENVNGGVPRHVEVEADVDGCSDLLDRNTNIEGTKNKWALVQPGTKIIVQVTKEELGTKGPRLTAIPQLRSRFWVLKTRRNSISVSKKIRSVAERKRLKGIAKNLKPEGLGLIVRTFAADRSTNELTKDLEGLLSIWKDIMEHAKSAALAADEDVEGEPYVMLHSAMGQTLSIVQDYFSKEVKSMVVDSPRTYHEVITYLEEKAPDLCDRVELYRDRTPLFDKYNIEKEMDNMLINRVDLPNGAYLVIEQTEALVSVDVNSGKRMTNMQEEAILSVNRDAAKQIARELRLRDIGGIIVVDFLKMEDHIYKRLVYDEIKEAVKRDRSTVNISELSMNGIMEITRKRARMDGIAKPESAQSYPRFEVLVDRSMLNYLTSGNRKRLVVLSSVLKVRIFLKICSRKLQHPKKPRSISLSQLTQLLNRPNRKTG
ncbi:ribonuclease E/G-like protein, chloroplastic isoform X3 [Rhododendron vialii]|uniref:ribonuclease E/G-like protein, chloroplastic isoform X3 n=1 Tax=Rhododendron vialii TaxID=182163 RepID=UPI00265E99E8|nr:ribonuclease E/G-like protein, chloroplastic isoform X3 [Rhododendron vialii]